MKAADIQKVKDAFVTVWTQASPPSVQVLDELAVPAEYQRAVLRLPYSSVPAELRGYLQQADIDTQRSSLKPNGPARNFRDDVMDS